MELGGGTHLIKPVSGRLMADQRAGDNDRLSDVISVSHTDDQRNQ